MASRCQNCEIIAKYKYWNELPSSKRSFFTIMANDFHHQMNIPEEFMEGFKGELGRWCILRGPTGKEWRVQIKRTKSKAFFSEGWDNFVRDHGLRFMDLCVFSYSGDSSFEVLIFKATGSEREEAYFTDNSCSFPSPITCSSSLHAQHSKLCEDVADEEELGLGHEVEESGRFKEQQDDNDHEDDSLIQINDKRETLKNIDDSFEDEDEDEVEEVDEDEDEDEDEEEEESSYGRSRQRSTSRGAKQPQTVYISKRREVTKEEIKRANDSALSYVLQNEDSGMPTIKIEMLPTHVYRGFHLTIKKEWALEYMCLENHDVKLRVSGGEGSWVVGCRWTKNLLQCQLRVRWPTFVLDNNLEEHDVCVFEMLRKGNPRSRENAVFNVTIFRVVDEVVPLKKVRKLGG